MVSNKTKMKVVAGCSIFIWFCSVFGANSIAEFIAGLVYGSFLNAILAVVYLWNIGYFDKKDKPE